MSKKATWGGTRAGQASVLPAMSGVREQNWPSTAPPPPEDPALPCTPWRSPLQANLSCLDSGKAVLWNAGLAKTGYASPAGQTIGLDREIFLIPMDLK